MNQKQHFPVALQAYVIANATSLTALSRLTGVAQSDLSRICSGQKAINRETLWKILANEGLPLWERKALLSAYLLDHIPPGMEHHITISDTHPQYTLRETEPLEEALEWLKENSRQSLSLRQWLLSTIRLLRGER